MDKKRVPFDVPEEAHDKLRRIAAELQIGSVAELMRIALVDYCNRHGADLTVDELSLGQWGGHRSPQKEKTS